MVQTLTQDGNLTILRLPTEILLIIITQFGNPLYYYTLGLSCRTLYPLTRFSPTLPSETRSKLLILLEKDWGDKFYYCPICPKLHRFSPSTGPLNPDDDGVHNDNHYCLDIGQYKLRYHHAHLVMNRQIYGEHCGLGLPLDALNASNVPLSTVSPHWKLSFSARIINNHLFFRTKQTLTSQDMSHRDFRALVTGKQRAYSICPHVDKGNNIWPLLWTQRSGLPSSTKTASGPLFEECRNVLDGCEYCDTDHCTSIVWNAEAGTAVDGQETGVMGEGMGTWTITIFTYYQIGDCRSVDDWKWNVKSWFADVRSPRDGIVGSVRYRWRSLNDNL